MKLQKIISIPLCLCAVLALLSCSRVEDGNVDSVLDCAYSLMEERPDSALALLESIPEESLDSRRLLARRSLLLAMARDKNYIDDTTDAVIAPAVDWYRRHGTADEKLLMNYYRGIVELNRCDYEEAMGWFVKSEGFSKRTRNKRYVGRLHSAKSSVYDYIFDIESVIREERMAGQCFLEAGDSSAYFNAVINMTTAANKLNDTSLVRVGLDKLSSDFAKLDAGQKSSFYGIELSSGLYRGRGTLDNVVHECISQVSDSSQVLWNIIAYAYLDTKEYGKADAALTEYRKYNNAEFGQDYHWLNGRVDYEFGKYRSAADSFLKYIAIDGGRNLYVLGSDAKYIEERTESGRKIESQHNTIIIVILLLLSAVLFIIVLIGIHYSQQKISEAKIRAANAEEEARNERMARAETELKRLEAERSRYECLYNSVLMQKEILEDAQKEMPKFGDEIKAALREQLNALNKFFMANITSVYSENAAEQLAELIRDQKHFLVILRSSFMVSYPKFMDYLKESGLSDKEMEYCCLYCIGLNGNETASFLKRPSYKNEVLQMRKKLKMVRGDTNIDIFLRRKLAELS